MVVLRKQNPHHEMNFSRAVKSKTTDTAVTHPEASTSRSNLDKIRENYQSEDKKKPPATSYRNSTKIEKTYPYQINPKNQQKTIERPRYRSPSRRADKSRSPRSPTGRSTGRDNSGNKHSRHRHQRR